jgi:hypothetical protein
LKEVLSTTVRAINFIKGRPLSDLTFKIFCEEIKAEYEARLNETEVRWLSTGQILKRLFQLRKEKTPLMEHFVRKGFTHGLAYLADVLPK